MSDVARRQRDHQDTSSSTGSVEQKFIKTGHAKAWHGEEYRKIEALSAQYGVPGPGEIYVIPRDFVTGRNPNLIQYSSTMPEGLSKWVGKAEFEYTIRQINSNYAKAQQVDCGSVWGAVWNFLSCFLVRAFRKSEMERAIDRVRKQIHHQNEEIYHPLGFRVVEPAARGLRHVEFRSVTYASMKYYLDHEAELPVAESESS